MPDEIELYSRAISGLRSKLETWEQATAQRSFGRRIISTLFAIFLVLFTFSVVPLLPLAITALLPAGFLGPIPFGGFQLSALLAAWAGFGILFGLLSIVFNHLDSSKPRDQSAPGSLTPQQLTFLNAYEASSELDIYLVSNVDDHLVNAQRLVRMLFRNPRMRRFGPDLALIEGPDGTIHAHFDESQVRRVGPDLPSRIGLLQRVLDESTREGWLRLEASSLGRVHALVGLPTRLLPRLELRQDLPEVRDALRALSEFSFAFLPDRQQGERSAIEEQHRAGLVSLDRLGSILAAMPSVDPPARQTHVAETETHLSQLAAWMKGPSASARFVRWCSILLPITVLITIILGIFVPLQGETIAYIVVPTTVLGAATLTAVRPGDAPNS
jgi:hypothetical protein